MSEGYEDERITRALETAPDVLVPEDFALRVSARMPAEGKPVREFVPAASRVGSAVSFVALALLAVVMLALAPWASSTGRGTLIALDWVLCAEFVGLAVWMAPALGTRR